MRPSDKTKKKRKKTHFFLFISSARSDFSVLLVCVFNVFCLQTPCKWQSTASETFHWWLLDLIFIYIYLYLFIYIYIICIFIFLHILDVILLTQDDTMLCFILAILFHEENISKCLLSHTSRKSKINNNYFLYIITQYELDCCVYLRLCTMVLNM